MHILVQVTSALAVSRSSRATLLLTSLKMLWSTQDPADTCSSCIEDRFVKKHISCGQTWECVSIFHLHRFWVQCEFSCSIRFQGLRGFKASSTFADTSLSSMSGDYIGLVAIGLHWPKRATGKLRDSLLCLFVCVYPWLHWWCCIDWVWFLQHCSAGLSESCKSSCTAVLLWVTTSEA